MFKIEFTLKQHTPIIHFQHDQEGATLRATEVKSKLDRFLIKLKGGIDTFRRDHPDWFLSEKHNSLNYKISILPSGEAAAFAISSNPSSDRRDDERIKSLQQYISAQYLNRTQYFADNQFIDKPHEHSRIRRGILYRNLKLKVHSLIHDLLLFIESALPSFIVSENFGTRQSKGFGCFSIEGMSEEKILEHLKSINSITGIFKLNNSRPFQEKVQFISEHYGKLKRGSSFGRYQKSKLWEYLCSSKYIKWEKRKLKLHIKDNDIRLFNRLKYDNQRFAEHKIDDCEHSNGNEIFLYIRALLGLAEQYEFMLINPNDKLKVSVKDTLKNNANTEKYSIDRFRSPIRYYLTDNCIYLITEEIIPLLQNYTDQNNISHPREFEFTIETMQGNNRILLQVPQSFDLPDFIGKFGNFGNNLK